MPSLREQLAFSVRHGRTVHGWSQDRLGELAGVSRSMIARVEAASVNVSIDTADRVLRALDARTRLDVALPFIAGSPRQQDAGHAHCSAYVQRRLEALGWFVLREVEIHHGRSHGWIDLLAFHPGTRTLVVIEVKTELHDLGQIERTLAWYEREAWSVARQRGWRPVRLAAWLIVLATVANDERIRENRLLLRTAFPGREPGLVSSLPARALAMIDPRSRRNAWLIRARIDGRRSEAPYLDYGDFLRRSQGTPPRARPHGRYPG